MKENLPIQKVELLTKKEVAEFLKAIPCTIYRWTKKGLLKSYGIGRRVYYKRHEVLRDLLPLNH